MNYEYDWGTLILFSAAAAIAELTSVRLFESSHSRVSIVTIFTIATIVLLGPWGGALVSAAGGLMTSITTASWFNGKPQKKTQLNWWRRSLFNMSMWLIAAVCAGFVYRFSSVTPDMLTAPVALLSIFLAATTDFVVNMLLLLIVIHFHTGRPMLEIWRQDWQWTYPISIGSGIIGGGGIAYIYETTGLIGLSIFMLPLLATGYAFQLYTNRMRSYVDQLEAANSQLDEANLGLLQTLAAVVDAYDIYTFGHSAQVARYAEAIAKEMGLPKEEQAKIFRGGLIHDVGKVGVTDAIIGKKGRLTDEEYQALKLHTVIGADIVSQMPQFRDLVPLVRNHHERWDGRGYPDGLKGEENVLSARIMCLADSVEAMLSDRPYQATRTLPSVVEEVIRCSGSQFDPLVVDAFLRVVHTRGSDFFVNSASAVARQLEEQGKLETLDGLCYVKKSMIAHQLKAANRNAF
jgi:putative nucleotidyltransferase with HDIG domain